MTHQVPLFIASLPTELLAFGTWFVATLPAVVQTGAQRLIRRFSFDGSWWCQWEFDESGARCRGRNDHGRQVQGHLRRHDVTSCVVLAPTILLVRLLLPSCSSTWRQTACGEGDASCAAVCAARP
jgi:hypothetical protein